MIDPARWTSHDLPVAASTNDEAADRLRAGVAPPLLVRARRQTAGRGRQGRAWFSDEGSLIVSLGLDPAAYGLAPAHWPCIALTAAVALIDALESAWIDRGVLGVRWPNDIEANGRKLAGLLPESVPTPIGPRLVLGLGANIRTDLAAAPAEVRAMATTVAHLAGPGRPATVEAVLAAFTDRIESHLTALGAGESWLPARWASLDALAGQPVRIDLGARVVVGVARRVTATGGLEVVTASGVETLHGGQVLRDPPTGTRRA